MPTRGSSSGSITTGTLFNALRYYGEFVNTTIVDAAANTAIGYEAQNTRRDVSIVEPAVCKNCQIKYCGCNDCKEYNPCRAEGYCTKRCYIEKESLTKALKNGIIVLDKEL